MNKLWEVIMLCIRLNCWLHHIPFVSLQLWKSLYWLCLLILSEVSEFVGGGFILHLKSLWTGVIALSQWDHSQNTEAVLYFWIPWLLHTKQSILFSLNPIRERLVRHIRRMQSWWWSILPFVMNVTLQKWRKHWMKKGKS